MFLLLEPLILGTTAVSECSIDEFSVHYSIHFRVSSAVSVNRDQYSHFRVSSAVCTLHTQSLMHVIIIL